MANEERPLHPTVQQAIDAGAKTTFEDAAALSERPYRSEEWLAAQLVAENERRASLPLQGRVCPFLPLEPREFTVCPKGVKKTNRPVRKGRPREDSSTVPAGVQELLALMLDNIRKCIPISTCCAAIGLEHSVWQGYMARYPALLLAIKRERALRLIELQEIVEAGGQGWQASARTLESLDGENWNKSASAAKPATKTPLSGAVKGKWRGGGK
ncbi:MAG: hypothetical protein WC829_02650 [Hyphomicrobium sp.]|jgi:hypothetical protein